VHMYSICTHYVLACRSNGFRNRIFWRPNPYHDSCLSSATMAVMHRHQFLGAFVIVQLIYIKSLCLAFDINSSRPHRQRLHLHRFLLKCSTDRSERRPTVFGEEFSIDFEIFEVVVEVTSLHRGGVAKGS
jgi:hypothetical protein